MTSPDLPGLSLLTRVPLRVRMTLWGVGVASVIFAVAALLFLLYAVPLVDRVPTASALVLLTAFAVTVCATGVATWIITGAALKPLAEVQEFAESISAETLSSAPAFASDSPEVSGVRDELNAALRRLETAYDVQARFLANVSHELKTPISVVRTEAEVLLAGTPDRDELAAFAKSAAEEMDRLGRMIESFLLLTRVRHGARRVRLAELDANELLMACFEQAQGMARQYDVRLNPTLCESEDTPGIRGNRDLLETALGNLVHNAIRFAPTNSVIDLSCEHSDAEIGFRVRDRGAGIPDELRERLFEPFTQSAEERRRGRGTGLGLQIAQGIAELHDGSISVQNVDPGAEFTLRLPIASLEIGQAADR